MAVRPFFFADFLSDGVSGLGLYEHNVDITMWQDYAVSRPVEWWHCGMYNRHNPRPQWPFGGTPSSTRNTSRVYPPLPSSVICYTRSRSHECRPLRQDDLNTLWIVAGLSSFLPCLLLLSSCALLGASRSRSRGGVNGFDGSSMYLSLSSCFARQNHVRRIRIGSEIE
jgi:hypothetical protein